MLSRQPSRWGTGSDLWALSRDGRVSPPVDNETSASVSPNGHYLAHASDESGRSEVYVVPMTGGSRVQVSVDGGNGPTWSHDGRGLFYRCGDKLVSVGVRTDKELSLGTHATNLDRADYDAGVLP